MPMYSTFQGSPFKQIHGSGGGMSNACEMVFIINMNIWLPGKNMLFQAKEELIEGWFMPCDTASLCKEELVQNVKVGLIPKWAQQKISVWGFVAPTIVNHIRFLISEERSLR